MILFRFKIYIVFTVIQADAFGINRLGRRKVGNKRHMHQGQTSSSHSLRPDRIVVIFEYWQLMDAIISLPIHLFFLEA